MSRPQYITDAARLVRAKLDPTHPAYAASEDVTAALAVMRLYLDSWVFPLLDVIEKGKAEPWQRETIARDAARLARVTQADPLHRSGSIYCLMFTDDTGKNRVVINSGCATRESADTFASDRKANEQAFPNERVTLTSVKEYQRMMLDEEDAPCP